MQTKQSLLFSVFLIFLSVLLTTGCSNSDTIVQAEEAKQSPEKKSTVSLVTLQEVQKALEKNKGKVSIVNLWATWCPPCVAEIPHLSEFYREMDPEKVAFTAISLDDPQSAEKVVPLFQQKKKVPFDILVLKEPDIDALGKLLNKQLSGSIPNTLVYNSQGKLVKFWEGGISKSDLEGVVKPLL